MSPDIFASCDYAPSVNQNIITEMVRDATSFVTAINNQVWQYVRSAERVLDKSITLLLSHDQSQMIISCPSREAVLHRYFDQEYLLSNHLPDEQSGIRHTATSLPDEVEDSECSNIEEMRSQMITDTGIEEEEYNRRIKSGRLQFLNFINKKVNLHESVNFLDED